MIQNSPSLATRRCGARCELHTLGLGSGASTALLLRLARKGHGSAQFLADGAPDAREAMGNSTFFGGNHGESIKKRRENLPSVVSCVFLDVLGGL